MVKFRAFALDKGQIKERVVDFEVEAVDIIKAWEKARQIARTKGLVLYAVTEVEEDENV